jgi:hypothetical protein
MTYEFRMTSASKKSARGGAARGVILKLKQRKWCHVKKGVYVQCVNASLLSKSTKVRRDRKLKVDRARTRFITQIYLKTSELCITCTEEMVSYKKSLTEVAQLFEKRVEVKDRRYRLKTYREAFIGVDAVDCLHAILVDVDDKFTREHAILVGRELARKFRLFEHVTKDHLLKDDYIMYRFQSSRRTPTTEESDDEGFLDSLLNGEYSVDLGHGIDEDLDEVEMLGYLCELLPKRPPRPLFSPAKSLRNSLVASKSESRRLARSKSPERDFMRGVMRNFSGSRSSESSRSSSPVPFVRTARRSFFQSIDFSNIDMEAAAGIFENGVEVKTHRHRGRVYKNVFVGSDAVDFLIASRLAPSRQKAEIIGRELAKEFNLFQHVTGSHGKLLITMIQPFFISFAFLRESPR